MQGRAFLNGTKNYVSFLVRTALFPLIWLWAIGIAKKHTDTDKNAVPKVAMAIVLGVVFAGAGWMVLSDFEDGATDSMYDGMDNRLQQALGEAEYQDQVSAIAAADNSIGILTRNLNNAEEAGDEENATVFQESLDNAQAGRAVSLIKKALLERNHQFYVSLGDDLAAQDGAAIEAKIDTFLSATSDDLYDHEGVPAADAVAFDVDKSEKRADRAFEIKNKAQADMSTWMTWLLLPGLIGAFFAPLSMALGNVLKHAWVPSETVGYKEYPGASMGWFLLLGAFGVPALFFAAWAFWDMDVRSKDGQISL